MSNLCKLSVFWSNYCKEHPIWAKLGVLLYKIGISMGSRWGQKKVYQSQNFKVWQVHPHTKIFEDPLLGHSPSHLTLSPELLHIRLYCTSLLHSGCKANHVGKMAVEKLRKNLTFVWSTLAIMTAVTVYCPLSVITDWK